MATQLPEPEDESPASLEAPQKTKVLGMSSNTGALLCYLPICAINLIFSIIFVCSEPKSNHFLRFHAMQSLFFCGAYIVVGIAVGIVTAVLGFMPFLGFLAAILSLVWFVATFGFIGINIMMMFKAKKGEMYKLMYVGDLADQNA